MGKLQMSKIMILACAIVIAGGWTPLAASDSIRPLKMILLDLDKHIGELTINIEEVAERIEVLRGTEPIDDPIIQELRTLDLEGWELHEEQWQLQLKHLQFAEKLLKQFDQETGNKEKLLKTWIDHERDYETALEAYRDKRHAIEGARLQKEGKMIERYLR